MFQLRFRCPLPDVPLVDGRRVCASCEREVTDLTRCSREEADAWMRAHPGACVRLPARPWPAAAALGLALASGGAWGHSGDDESGDVIEIREPEPPVAPAELTAEAVGFAREADAEDAVARVRAHPGPFRKVLDPGGIVRAARHLTLVVAPDGHVSKVESSDLILEAPGFDAAFEKVSALRFAPSPTGARVVVRFGPPAE